MKTEVVKIELLQEPEKNVRIHTEQQYEELYRSYKMFGQYRPVVVDENNVVLAGNGFVEALRRNGETEVTVLRYTNLSEKDKKKLMIADNKTFSLGFDDNDAVMEMLAEMGDYEVPGFDEDLLKELLADEEETTEQLSDFGKLSPEEIQGFQEELEKTEERYEKALERQEQEQHEPSQQPIHHESPQQPIYHEPVYQEGTEDEGEYTQPSEVFTSTKKTIKCPHCSGEIVL